MPRYTGTVAWFNNAKGYGFLRHPERPDVFCHYTAIEMNGYKVLREGDSVEFDIELGASGKQQAARVMKAERSALSTG